MSLQAGVTGQIWPAKAQPHVPCPRSGASSPRHHLPRAERMSLSAQALQLCSSSLLVLEPGPGTSPARAAIPVFLKWLSWSVPLCQSCSSSPVPSSPFVTVISVKPQCHSVCPAVPLGHLVPKSRSQQSLWSAQGCREKWTSGDVAIPEPSSNKPGLGGFSCKFLQQREATPPSVTGPFSTQGCIWL